MVSISRSATSVLSTGLQVTPAARCFPCIRFCEFVVRLSEAWPLKGLPCLGLRAALLLANSLVLITR